MADPYATRAEMYALSLNQRAFGDISEADQDKALESASRTADSYLTNRFQLPLTAWGDDLREVVSSIAAYRALAARGFAPNQDDADQVRKRFDDAIKWLRDVGGGSATPVGIRDAGGNATDAAGEAAVAARPRVLQHYEGSEGRDSFWEKGTSSPGGVGPPKPRGW